MRSRRLTLLLLTLAGLLFISLAVYLLSNTRLDMTGSSAQDTVQIETTFPEATCQKTLRRSFPFVSLSCEKQELPGEVEVTPP